MRGEYVKSSISALVVLISVAVVAAIAVGSVGAATAVEEKRRPAVAVTSETPVVVAGRGFRGRERITLRLVLGSQRFAKAFRATRTGTFRATFVQADASCSPFTVIAVGRAGSRATQTRRFNIPPPCGIAPQP